MKTGVVAVWESDDEVMGVCKLCGLLELLLRGLSAKSNRFSNRSRKNAAALGYKSHLLPQIPCADLTEIFVVKKKLSLINAIEPKKK